MTTPAQAPPQQAPPGQQPVPTGAEAALVTTTAGLLLTAISAAALIEALKLRFTLSQDMWTALAGSASIAMSSPPALVGVVGPASAQTSRQNLARRAQFVVSAAKRLVSDIAAGRAALPGTPPGPAAVQAADLNVLRRAQFKEAKHRRLQADIARGRSGDVGAWPAFQAGMARERRYYSMHLDAMWNRAVAAGKTDMAALEYGDFLSWNAVRDEKTSAECKKADGKTYRASRMPEIGWPGSVHPHCFPAGTVVASPSLRAAAMRWYSGELIELTTFRGHHLAVTPNHPVLTSEGWVAAGLLSEGCDVVSTRFVEAVLNLVDPYDHQQPALIEDVLRSFSEHPGVLPRTVPVTAEDFHGDADGRDGEVAVIWADRVLVDDLEATHPQPRRIQEFGGEGRHGAVSLLGAGAPSVPIPGDTPDGIMGRRDVARVLLGRAVGHHEPVGVGLSPSPDSMTLKNSLDDDARGFVHLRQLVLAGPVDVGGADEVLGKVALLDSRSLPALAGPGVGGALIAERAALSQALGQQPSRNAQVVGDLLVSKVAGLVEFDRLVKVHRRASWSGHVFNLESSGGWLITDNIVTHNCRCFPGPPYPGAPMLP